jgi:hypothetical protein
MMGHEQVRKQSREQVQSLPFLQQGQGKNWKGLHPHTDSSSAAEPSRWDSLRWATTPKIPRTAQQALAHLKGRLISDGNPAAGTGSRSAEISKFAVMGTVEARQHEQSAPSASRIAKA